MEFCSVWGPTCDSIDCVQAVARLPTGALKVGDWLRWDTMGAYTICAASQVCPKLFDRSSAYSANFDDSLTDSDIAKYDTLSTLT